MTPSLTPRPIRPRFPGFPGMGGGNNGIMGFLQPLLSHINQDYQQDTVQPYVQQVEDLTRTTFPDVEFDRRGPRFPFQPGGGLPGVIPMPKTYSPGFGQGAPGILGLLGQQQPVQQAQPVGLGELR